MGVQTESESAQIRGQSVPAVRFSWKPFAPGEFGAIVRHMAFVCFSVRISDEDLEWLGVIARSRGRSKSEEARQIFHDGIRERLEPEDIDRRIESQRAKLQAAAKEIRRGY